MGSSFTNLHVRTDDASAVELALADADALPAYVTGAEGGWVSAYPEATDAQDLERLEAIGAALSAALGAPVVAFLVHDGAVFLYTLWVAGRAVEKSNSRPGFFEEEVEGQERPAEGGDVDAILRLAAPGTTPEAVRRILHDQVAEEAPPELRSQLAAQMDSFTTQMAGRLAGVDLGQMMASLEGGGRETAADRLALRLARLLGIRDDRAVAGWRQVVAGQGPSEVALLEPA